jgi:hypothetical protein
MAKITYVLKRPRQKIGQLLILHLNGKNHIRPKKTKAKNWSAIDFASK